MGTFYKTKFSLICLLISTSLLFNGCSNKPNNFSILCSNLEELSQIPGYKEKTPQDRYYWVLKKTTSQLGEHADATEAWSSIGYAPALERYSLLEEAAVSVGNKNWNCPAAKSILHEVGL